jgi:hypothetical protein
MFEKFERFERFKGLEIGFLMIDVKGVLVLQPITKSTRYVMIIDAMTDDCDDAFSSSLYFLPTVSCKNRKHSPFLPPHPLLGRQIKSLEVVKSRRD